MQNEFEKAIAKLIDRSTRPRDRLLYRLRDVVKKPTEILQQIGDRFVAVGREEAIIGQVKGLSAFWRSVLEAPLRNQVEVCSAIAPRVAEDNVWKVSLRLAKRMDDSIRDNVWKGN